MKKLPALFVMILVVALGVSWVRVTQFNSDDLSVIKWSSDSKQIAIGKNNLTVQIVNFETTTTRTIALPDAIARIIEWSPNDQHLAIYGDILEVRNSVSGELLQQLDSNVTRAGGYDISDFSWSPDGQYLAVGLYSGTGGLADSFVFIWNVETDVIEQRLVLGAADLDWHPTAPLIAQTPSPFSYETRNSIIDAETGTIEPIFSGTMTASAIDWSPDGTKLALVYDNPVDDLPSNTHLAIWDLASRNIISDYEFEDEGIAYFIRTIQWGPDNRHILVVDGMDMYVWDSVENHVATDFGVPALQADWRHDGSTVAYFTQNERSLVQYIDTPQYAVKPPS